MCSKEMTTESCARMVLLALLAETKGRTGTRLQTPTVLRRFKKDRRGLARIGLHAAARHGLVVRCSAKGKLMWRITKEGTALARSLA